MGSSMLTECMPNLVRAHRGHQDFQCWGALGEIHLLGSGTDSLRQSTNTEYLVEMEGTKSHLPAGPSKEHLDKNVEGDPRQLGDPSPCLWLTEQPTLASLGCVGSHSLEAEGWT